MWGLASGMLEPSMGVGGGASPAGESLLVKGHAGCAGGHHGDWSRSVYSFRHGI